MENIKKNKHEDFIIQTLFKDKFLAGNDLNALLVKQFDIKDSNARKIVQRATSKGHINSSSPITFGKGQFIYFLPNDSLTKTKVKEISKKYRPPLYRLIEALDDNGGIISYYEGLKIVGSPIKASTTKVDTLDDLLSTLEKLEIVSQKTDLNSVKYIFFRNQTSEDELIKIHFSKMTLDVMFIPDILRWFRKNNILNNLKTIYRNKKTPSIGAVHNGLIWDAYAYTKTTGINPVKGKNADTIEKQTLVVFDVVINREYKHYDLDGFYSRIQINLNSTKTGERKVLPIILYKTISERVLNTLNSLGFMSFDLGSIFGSRIYEVIQNINNLEVNKNLSSEGNIEKIIKDTLSVIRASGQEDNLKDMKGVLFESLLFPLLKHLYSSAIILQGIIYSKVNEGKKEGYEYDYVIISSNPKEIIIVELKGYSSTSSINLGDWETKSTLSWFFKRTLPFIKEKFKKEISEGYSFKGCYITSGNFHENGQLFLKKMNESSFKPKNLEVSYDRKNILELLENNDFNKIKKTIEKFY